MTPAQQRVDEARRRAARYAIAVFGLAFVVGVPFLMMAAQPAPPDARAKGALAQVRQEAQPGATGAVAPPPVAPKPLTPEQEAAVAQERLETAEADALELLEPAAFECAPVAADTGVTEKQYPVPLPPFSKDVFPCTRCHDKPEDFNPVKRNLTLDHLNIKLVHGPREQWCYGCHNPTNRDTLRLAGGRAISFSESYELCGQCHGTKLRDWRLGIHGRRTGCWNGKRKYLLCVHCHSPHAPKFAPLAPLPRPKKPSELTGGGDTL